jgi:hypothetical protein
MTMDFGPKIPDRPVLFRNFNWPFLAFWLAYITLVLGVGAVAI